MHPNFFILEGFWDRMHIKYVHSEKANASGTLKALTIYVANAENFPDDWLDYIPKRDYLLISLNPSLLKQIFGQLIPVSHPPFIYQIEITNPSILHLAHLLQTEMEAPKIFSKEFVFAIVTTMIRYCEAKTSAEIGIIDANGVL
jgi:hypothetical protein